MQPVTPSDPSVTTLDSLSTDPAERSGGQVAGLYLFPAFFVLVLLLAALFTFAWLQSDQDPHSLLEGMRQPGRKGWQQAYALAQLLANPRYDQLKDDRHLCRALGNMLLQQNRQAESQHRSHQADDVEQIQLRVFLCRALGEFRLRDSLPFLLSSAASNSPAFPETSRDIVVRQAAFEGLAVLAGNLEPGELRTDPRTLPTVISATCAASAGATMGDTDVIAATATFALGVIGGPQATERLLELLSDPRADVRFNAATGLARHGDAAAVPVLQEMLTVYDAVRDSGDISSSHDQKRRRDIVSSGLAAAIKIWPALPSHDRRVLASVLVALADNPDVPLPLRVRARSAMLQPSRF